MLRGPGSAAVSNSSFLSASTRLFEDSAEQLAVRLERDGSPEAAPLAAEARALAAVFATWQRQRPLDDARIASIEQLFELNQRAMDFFAAR